MKRWAGILGSLLLMVGLGCTGAQAQGMSPPAFTDLDLNGDGVIDAEEFAQHQAARMSERHGKGSGKGQGQGQGYGMEKGESYGKKGGAGMGSRGIPAYGDIDLDGDACISAEEFSKHVAARHGTAAEAE